MNNQQQRQYKGKEREYQVVLPLDLGMRIAEDDSVRLLSQMMEEMDYSELNKAYSPIGRNTTVVAKNLFKIVIYARMNGLYSTRDIENACRRDINYIYLLEGQKAPDHNTIARFVSDRLDGVAEGLFYQLVKQLHECGGIAYENLFVDGTKIEANANRYSFVWRKAVSKNENKLNEKVNVFIKHVQETYEPLLSPKATLEELRQLLLTQQKAQGVVFVSGKGKRKSQLQRDIEALEELYVRQIRYDDYNDTFRGRNSFSKTDRDATFMRMKEDHMKNGQLKPAYNVQLGVEGEYIVGVDISSERSDQLTLIPMLNRMERGLGVRYANIVADAGYESEENYQHIQKNEQTAYIKPSNYEKSKTRKYRKNAYLRENMPYNEQSDAYTCPAGCLLRNCGEKSRKSKSGYTAQVTIYECDDCSSCQMKKFCTKARGNRCMEVSKVFLSLRKESYKSITSPKGILLRMNRSIQVEGAFGVLKQDYGFRRFFMRGKSNILTEMLLLAMAYNVNKLHNKIQQDRCGFLLHDINTA